MRQLKFACFSYLPADNLALSNRIPMNYSRKTHRLLEVKFFSYFKKGYLTGKKKINERKRFWVPISCLSVG